MEIGVTDLGRMGYQGAYARQQEMLERIVAARGSESPIHGHLFLVEHDPVITVSARAGASGHVLASAAQLSAAGVVVEPTDRGGDVTYHGPGQLVVYPIIDLNAFGLRLHDYMRMLEEAVIGACGRMGVATQRDRGATGVWVRGEAPTRGPVQEGASGGADGAPGVGGKICAMGVRVRKWVSMHGLALNVDPRMDHFGLIVPCGLVGRSVTSLRAELGDRCPTMDQVKRLLVEELTSHLRARAR